MPDPTESVIIATFCTALGIFALTATARKLLGGKPTPVIPLESTPADEESPYQGPVIGNFLPPLTVGRVPVEFYRPLDLLGLSFIFLFFFSLVIGSVRASAGKDEMVLTVSSLISSIGFQFVSAGIVTAFVVSRVRPVEWLGLRWPGWRWVFLIAPGAVLSMWAFFSGLEATGFMRWIDSLGLETVQETVKILQNSTNPEIVGLMVIAAVVAAPLCEEVVFRGYLYPAAKRFAGPWAAGIGSALVFAAAHGSIAALLPLFVFGCLLIFIYEKTGSLWAPIAVHFCFNGATVVIQLAARHYNIDFNAP